MTLDKMNDFIDTLFDGSEIRTYGVHEQNDSYYIETEFYSDLGEDVNDTIWFDNLTPKSLIKGLEDFKENIREQREELLELYISERPRGTEQFSVMQLVNDNEEIINFWHDTIDQAIERYRQKGNA